VLRAVVTELLPIAALAVVIGVGLGYLGSLGIVAAFERADAVEIGLVFATGAIPIAAAAVVGGALVLGAVMSRQVTRRTPAVTLRGAV
jgi:ABC-type antimicrobial peptide transport system permease subunit